jgi:hypothetical protein
MMKTIMGKFLQRTQQAIRRKPSRKQSIRRGVTWLQIGTLLLTQISIYSQAQTKPSQSGGQILVGPNVYVSQEAPKDMHMQVLVAANPIRPNEFAACSNHQLENTNRTISSVYVSPDAGRTWSHVFTGDDHTDDTDPTVAYGPDGTIYYAYLSHPLGEASQSVVFHSRDGGKTWSAPVRFEMLDRHFLVVDSTQSRYRGRIYIGGLVIGGYGLRRSLDGGKTFSGEVRFNNLEGRITHNHSPGAVLSDGTVVFLNSQIAANTSPYRAWPTTPNTKIVALRSQDGGATISIAGTVTSDATYSNNMLATNDFSALTVDASEGPFHDRIYAAYTNYDSVTGRRDIMVAYSSDKGAIWSKPIAVNDDALPANLSNSPKHFMPALAVNRNGVVGITWYDRRESKNGYDFIVRFAASLDGGETFQRSVVVSEVPFDAVSPDASWNVRGWVEGGGYEKRYRFYRREQRKDGMPLNSQFMVISANFFTQHTAGLAADGAGVFHAMWVNNRAGVPQVWTAPITVKGTAARNGSAEMAELDDVTDQVAVHYDKIRYDRRARLLTVDAQVENVSNQPLNGPVMVRVISAAPREVTVPPLSGQGNYEISEADNGLTGIGAVWRFQSARADGRLLPNERSRVRRLKFRITAEPTLAQAHQSGLYNGGYLNLVEFDARALAKR